MRFSTLILIWFNFIALANVSAQDQYLYVYAWGDQVWFDQARNETHTIEFGHGGAQNTLYSVTPKTPEQPHDRFYIVPDDFPIFLTIGDPQKSIDREFEVSFDKFGSISGTIHFKRLMGSTTGTYIMSSPWGVFSGNFHCFQAEGYLKLMEVEDPGTGWIRYFGNIVNNSSDKFPKFITYAHDGTYFGEKISVTPFGHQPNSVKSAGSADVLLGSVTPYGWVRYNWIKLESIPIQDVNVTSERSLIVESFSASSKSWKSILQIPIRFEEGSELFRFKIVR
jgi:hypothetical protein